MQGQLVISEGIRALLTILVGVGVVVFVLKLRKRKRDEGVVRFIDPVEVRRRRVAKFNSSPEATTTTSARRKRTVRRGLIPVEPEREANTVANSSEIRGRRQAFYAAPYASANCGSNHQGGDDDAAGAAIEAPPPQPRAANAAPAQLPVPMVSAPAPNPTVSPDETSTQQLQHQEHEPPVGAPAVPSTSPTEEAHASVATVSAYAPPPAVSPEETVTQQLQHREQEPPVAVPAVLSTQPTAVATTTPTPPPPPGTAVPGEPSHDLPGWMKLGELLELLASGARPAYEVLIGIVCVDEAGNDLLWRSHGKGVAGPSTTTGVCRRWWDAAWEAGEAAAAEVAADVLGLHLDAMQDDLFTSATEQRATLLLAFLGTSPSPLMVRRVFSNQPSAARAALRLAMAPLTGVAAAGGSEAPGGRTPAARLGAPAEAAGAAETTRRLEAWQPLEGLEGLERLLRSAAGASALAIVLGLEARREYAHGKELEAESVLAPLLGGLPCVLSLNGHLRVAHESVGLSSSSPGSSLGNQLAQQRADEAWNRVPAAHRLAKQLAEIKSAGPRSKRALIHAYEASFDTKARNRQAFVGLVEAALVKAMTTRGTKRESKSDVCAWLSKVIFLHESLPEMCNQRAPELLGGEGSTCASSGFLMSFSALLLRMGAAKFASVCPKNMDSIDIGYVEWGSVTWASTAVVADDDDDDDDGEPDEDTHEQPSEQPAVESNGARGVEERKEGEPGGQQESENSSSTTGSTNSRGEAGVTTGGAGRNDGSDDAAPGTSAKKEEHTRRGFSFATELFFLTHRALQVIVSSLERRRAEMHKLLDSTALLRHGQSLSGGEGDDNETAAAGRTAGGVSVYKEADTAVFQGWAIEGFGSDAVTGLACQLANFTKSWLGLYIGGGGGLVSLPLVPSSLSLAAAGFSKVAPALIETICAAWVRAAVSGREDKFLSRRAAEEAAVFCGEVMERVDLGLSPVTQAKLVEVLEVLVQTGTRALEGNSKGKDQRGAAARPGGFRGSLYWGSRRGYAGAIMDSGELRRSLPRQLMTLYASVQAIEGLGAEHYLGYFKFSVRVRAGKILGELWSHPLGEPRQAILDLVRASTATEVPAMEASATAQAEIAAGTADVSTSGGGSGGGSTSGGGGSGGAAAGRIIPAQSLATEFFKSAFDTITYFFNDALDRLRDGVIEERANGGRVIETGHAHWNKYMSDRKQVVSALKGMTLPVLRLLATLGEEREVMDALRAGALGARSAAMVSVVLRSLYGEESSAFAVKDPEAWGLNKAELGGTVCELLVGLTAHGDPATTAAVAAALHHADPDFDGALLAAAAAGDGGECLRGSPSLSVTARLSRALEEDDARRRAEEERAAAAAAEAGGGQGGGDPFEGLPADGIDGEALAGAYGDALEDLVHTQVESLSPGHYFDSRREGSTLTQPRKVATEIMRKLPRMLPSPPHPASAVFAVVEEDALNFARFVISGPAGSPYEGGLFVFDVFLPTNYPADPPLVQMVTTGQGTVKFNVNLYADGKVCLSLLGKDSGASASGGDKWNPETSSLWQVFASIQTQVFVKDPYYNEGGGRSNLRGRGTAETEEASKHENARVTLETIRHAAVANLRRPPAGCEKLVQAHFRALRERVLLRCREAVEEAPDERLRKATLRASAELRVELDKLLVDEAD